MTQPLREAATVCLVRDGDDGLEVLMARRTPSARFMGGAWVFPGGAVDGEDERSGASGSDRWRAAAVREVAEETGIRLVGHDLVYFANWITPAPLPIRFDTRFFAAVVGRDVEPLVDGDELVDARWMPPSDVLAEARRGTMLVAFPTRKTVEYLGTFGTSDLLLSHIKAQPSVVSIQPRLAVGHGAIQILMPDDPGFDEAAVGERDPDLMARMMKIAADGGDVPPEFRPA
ncbi:MAG: NUDIX hydrolase [Actinomycetota bacterium]|nr:NUDIX hydrolase [Actinomycetota bacterium]